MALIIINIILGNNAQIQSADLNNDDSIDILDIIILVNVILGIDENGLADINEDSSTNIQDIILLINIILNN